MSRSLILAGLLVDAWRDESPRTEPRKTNLPGGAIPVSRLRGTSDDVALAPRLTSPSALDATKCEPG
jgi:hypothetical protein